MPRASVRQTRSSVREPGFRGRRHQLTDNAGDPDHRCACPLPSRRSRNLIPIEYRTTRPIRLRGTVKPSRKSRLSCQISFLLCFFSSDRRYPHVSAYPSAGKGPVGGSGHENADAVAADPRPVVGVTASGLGSFRERGLETAEAGPAGSSSRHWRCALTSCRRLSAWSDIVPPFTRSRPPGSERREAAQLNHR